MAKNIKIAGASYPSVPALSVPRTEGGTVLYYDCVGDKEITENGTYSVVGYANAVVNVQGGIDPTVLDGIHQRLMATLGV